MAGLIGSVSLMGKVCFILVIVLQLSDLSLVAVDFTLQAFNLLFVVVNFFLVMLLQCSQLLLLFASKV